jgi:cobalt-zinc-cadmium efflux system membrane fusion protein
MPRWFRSLATRAASRFPTVLTLTALGALAVWGWRNDWKLSASGSADREAAEAQTAARPAVQVLAPSSGSGTGSDTQTPPGSTRLVFPSADAVVKVGIHVAPAREQTLVHAVTAPGAVDYDPGRYARLTARASGTVLRVDKEVGDPVRQGDVLALIDAAEVGRIKADFLQDLAQVRLRAASLEHLQAADRTGSVPDASLRQAQASLREARIRLFNDQQALLNLGLPVRLPDVEKLPDDQLVVRLRLLGLPPAVAAELNPETLTANLLPLTAPFDGRVVERNAARGEVVQLNQPTVLFTVGDTREVHIDLNVNPEDMAGVRLGQPVRFQPNDGGPEAAGQVSHISPEVNAKTRRVRVHAHIPNPEGRLRPNTFGTGRILVGQRPNAVVVPGEAVQAEGGSSMVFVRLSETVFEARPVQVGLRQGDQVEVSGVRPGEEVVTTGSFVLRSELVKERIAGGD